MMKKNQKRFAKVVIFMLLLAAMAAAGGYYLLYGKVVENKAVVRIDDNTAYGEVVAQIRPALSSDIHRFAFDVCAKCLQLKERYQVGNYSFGGNVGVLRMVRRMSRGSQSPVKLVVNVARTLPQLASKLSTQIAADSTTLLVAMRDEALRSELGLVKDSTIVLFIPNTYEVYWDIEPEALVRRMHKEYNRFWNKKRTAKLERCGLSKYEVMTLASIVYEETKVNDEMAAVAGVYMNRLRKKMRLQADPTVKYALGDFAIKRVMKAHTEYDSPFNTYRHAGLPPAPICIPSIAAIDAVLNYQEHDYLYFCARPELDGRHNFARTLDEHNVNARSYREALNKRGIK